VCLTCPVDGGKREGSSDGVFGAGALVIGASVGVISQSRDQSGGTYIITDLGTLGGDYSLASGINASGHVVGHAWMIRNDTWHAFVWQDGVMRDLGTLEGGVSFASDISDAGEVVGSVRGLAGNYAYVWQNGVMRDLGTLGGPSNFANGINDSGQIVGSSTGRASLWQGGAMSDLGTLGGSSSAASAIRPRISMRQVRLLGALTSAMTRSTLCCGTTA
jgi:probable HAF family extracellular repeat protein